MIFPTCQWIEREPSWKDSCKCQAKPVPSSPWCQAHLAKARGRASDRAAQETAGFFSTVPPRVSIARR